MSKLCQLLFQSIVLTSVLSTVTAHDHGHLHPSQTTAPIDAILWIHILVQVGVWGALFPIGMVLGMTRSRWHVALQATGFALTTAGYILGHAHKGRMFPASVHGSFASLLLIPIAIQLFLGIYLKLHIHEKSFRPYAVLAHGIIGKSYPILGWIQMLFGALTLRGYCRDGALGQCLAHYIMGSGFIAYACVMAIIFLVGKEWVKKSRRSPEWWDSWVIMLWGIVNTFTEHRGSIWSVKDMQHTILGILWWTGGLLGILLARHNQRNVIPAIIIILTGWAMSEHAQALKISTKVHTAFGSALMLAGVTRIIEICFISSHLSDIPDNSSTSDGTHVGSSTTSSRVLAIRAFCHLPPFCLVSAGLLFMSATDEELEFVHEHKMDHVTYILIMLSIALLLYAFIVFLVHLYSSTGHNARINLTVNEAGSIEMNNITSSSKWYTPLPNAEFPAVDANVTNEDD